MNVRLYIEVLFLIMLLKCLLELHSIPSLPPSRHWRVGQVDLHQADAHHPRVRLLGRGQARLHQTRLSKHLHGDAEHDPRHGDAADLLRERRRGRPLGGEAVELEILNVVLTGDLRERDDLVNCNAQDNSRVRPFPFSRIART